MTDENENKRKHKRFFFILPAIIVLSILFFILVSASLDNSKVKLGCKFTDIEYRDVTPNSCWGNDDYNRSSYCPMPKNIDCEGEASSIGTLIGALVSNIK